MIVAIIPARGGSKGIPKKNLMDVCGRPLLSWSILQALDSKNIDAVYVTSDSDEILEMAKASGAHAIKRPDEISGDFATSESAWMHALNHIEETNPDIDSIVLMQATSPVRSGTDLDRAIEKFQNESLDSLFSASNIGDFFIWREASEGLESINYDYKNRKRRQDFGSQILENGSFYICKPEILRTQGNRLGGKIGFFEMPIWKSFEIDELEDLELIEVVMKNLLLKGEV